MDVDKISDSLSAFIKTHSLSFHHMALRETALLELGALTIASEHYRILGYSVTAENPQSGLFAAKLSSRGHPFNFSWFRCEKGGDVFEIHSNLAVAGGHKDGAVYVVDVAVVAGDAAVPKIKPKTPWVRLDNKDLVSFVEVKKLVVYPMLLAQFVGIVHEIMPQALKRTATAAEGEDDHFPPTLVSLGYMKGTSASILKGFAKRKYRVCIIHSFDAHLYAMSRGSVDKSPFITVAGVI